jgi:hypothetical protein
LIAHPAHRSARGPVARVPRIGVRLLPALLVALLVLAGCGAPGLDGEQRAASERTCASLLERVANRTLARAGVLAGAPADVDADEKLSPLSPAGLVDDPAAFYATLDERLAEADLVAADRTSPVSPATRLVDACRRLG